MITRRTSLGIAAGILVSDQVTKAGILYWLRLPERQSIDLSPIFDLTMVWNKGVSFGMFPAESVMARAVLIAFSLAVVAYLLWWLRKATHVYALIGIGLVTGGALGNAIDRLIYGAVVDFLDFSGLYFPYVFNIADAAITLGVIALLLEALIGRDEPEDEAPQARKAQNRGPGRAPDDPGSPPGPPSGPASGSTARSQPSTSGQN